MRTLTLAQSVEVFQLAILTVLQVRLNQDRYILKGGANLRYFYESPRYSEDMDLDAVGIDRWKLEEKIDDVLASRALIQTVRSKDVSIAEITKPKQTETTQRWKLALAVPGRRVPFWTKIEFSRRGLAGRSQLDQVPTRIVEKYALRPPTVRHYLVEAMILQKITALSERSETQARDVFDLDLLFRQYPEMRRQKRLSAKLINEAIERVVELPFGAFRTQVVEFFDPDIVELYENPRAWDEIQQRVMEKLARLR